MTCLVDVFGGVEEEELLPGSSGGREGGQCGEGAAQRIHDRREARGALDVVCGTRGWQGREE